jgi:prepilin-type N-terminal cleavage/methylation domain-containing protein
MKGATRLSSGSSGIGFTLIELLVVIAIIAILASMVIAGVESRPGERPHYAVPEPPTADGHFGETLFAGSSEQVPSLVRDRTRPT